MAHTSQFSDVLEAADNLSHAEQEELIDILQRRLHKRHAANRSRNPICKQEFAAGQCSPTTPSELLHEILK